MPRRLIIRLAIALTGLVAALVGGLVALILATSAPVLPPAPLPTATAQPGPQATPLGGPRPGPQATPLGGPRPGPQATPLHLVPLLPTATPMPAAIDLAGIKSGAGADPNGAVRALLTADAADAAATDLVYRDRAHPRATDPACGPDGRWSLRVDPENVVGYPYSRAPSAEDWGRAARVVNTATAFCPAPIVLLWFAHDRARPSSDRWTVLLPSAVAAGVDVPTLRRYALAHARQV